MSLINTSKTPPLKHMFMMQLGIASLELEPDYDRGVEPPYLIMNGSVKRTTTIYPDNVRFRYKGRYGEIELEPQYTYDDESPRGLGGFLSFMFAGPSTATRLRQTYDYDIDYIKAEIEKEKAVIDELPQAESCLVPMRRVIMPKLEARRFTDEPVYVEMKYEDSWILCKGCDGRKWCIHE